jgi:chitin synthase
MGGQDIHIFEIPLCVIDCVSVYSFDGEPASRVHLSSVKLTFRARLLFTISMSGFAIIMAYTLFATIYLTVKSIEAALSGKNNLMGDNVFTNVSVALLSTAGLYLLTSLLYLDPWHMLSSFLQFTLLLPSFVCTLQIYAFCNT